MACQGQASLLGREIASWVRMRTRRGELALRYIVYVRTTYPPVLVQGTGTRARRDAWPVPVLLPPGSNLQLIYAWHSRAGPPFLLTRNRGRAWVGIVRLGAKTCSISQDIGFGSLLSAKAPLQRCEIKPSQVCPCNAMLSSTVYTCTENATVRCSQVSASNASNATGGHTAVAAVYGGINRNYAERKGGASGPD